VDTGACAAWEADPKPLTVVPEPSSAHAEHRTAAQAVAVVMGRSVDGLDDLVLVGNFFLRRSLGGLHKCTVGMCDLRAVFSHQSFYLCLVDVCGSASGSDTRVIFS
jgi:hypothetical protein